MNISPPVCGLVLMTRGPDGRNLLVGVVGSDIQTMVDEAMAQSVASGGSDHPEDWAAWTLSTTPTPEIMREIERLVTSGRGGVKHPAVIAAIFDPRHPKLQAKGEA